MDLHQSKKDAIILVKLPTTWVMGHWLDSSPQVGPREDLDEEGQLLCKELTGVEEHKGIERLGDTSCAASLPGHKRWWQTAPS